MSLETLEKKNYINIQGTVEENNVCFRKVVSEGTEEAHRRDYETSDGKKGTKWELWFKNIGGKIVNIDFFEGDYGKNLMITFDFEDDSENVILSLGVATKYGEDLLKKLPNINYNEWVVMTPYGFTGDNGKPLQGVSITQGDEKISGAFYDPEKKKNLLKMPESGEITDKEEWKIYFLKARLHMIKYAEEHILPQFTGVGSADTKKEGEEVF